MKIISIPPILLSLCFFIQPSHQLCSTEWFTHFALSQWETEIHQSFCECVFVWVCMCGRETCLACLVLPELKTHNILMRIFTICGQHLSFVLMVDKLNVQFVIFVIFLFVCCCYCTVCSGFCELCNAIRMIYSSSNIKLHNIRCWTWGCGCGSRGSALNADIVSNGLHGFELKFRVYPFVWLRPINQRLIDGCSWMYRINNLDWTSKCVLVGKAVTKSLEACY